MNLLNEILKISPQIIASRKSIHYLKLCLVLKFFKSMSCFSFPWISKPCVVYLCVFVFTLSFTPVKYLDKYLSKSYAPYIFHS